MRENTVQNNSEYEHIYAVDLVYSSCQKIKRNLNLNVKRSKIGVGKKQPVTLIKKLLRKYL